MGDPPVEPPPRAVLATAVRPDAMPERAEQALVAVGAGQTLQQIGTQLG